MLRFRSSTRSITRALAAGLCAAALAVAAMTQGLAAPSTPPGKFTATFLEMRNATGGNGLAVVLQTPGGRTYLYDAGVASKGDPFDAGRDAIAPFLKAQGVTELAGIAISHSHSDHYGGAPYLLEHFNVKALIDSGYDGAGYDDEYAQLRRRATGRGIYQVARAGDRLDWDPNLEVEVLSPPAGMLAERRPDRLPAHDGPSHNLPNLNSLVLRIRHGKLVFLFPGDLTLTGQDYLLERYKPEQLKCDVLAAPGHGHNSYLPFAEVARPDVVVVAGIRRYSQGEPKANTARTFGQLGSRIYVTYLHGQVQVISNGENYTMNTQRSPSSPARTPLGEQS